MPYYVALLDNIPCLYKRIFMVRFSEFY